ncbi:MAG: sugar phosphate nucleotidyltransferase, partial [Planctomycetota bacterium]
MTSASEAQAKAPSSRDARLAVVVLAAGKGTRLGLGAETPPKVLLECLGVPVLEHVRRAIVPLGAGDVVVITGHAAQRVDDWLAASWPEARPVHQIPQQGTGQALRLAMGALDGFEGDVLVVNGDVPQMRASDLAHLLRTHRDAGVAATVLSGIVSDPGQLGRIARDADGTFARIVEAPDAEAATLSIREFNTGLYAFDAAALRPALEDLPRDNAKGEEYLPDAVNRLAAGTGGVQASPSADPRALLGVNTLAELAGAAAILRRRVASAHMANGVFIDDPEHTTIEVDVEIAAGARILPYTHIGRGCRIGPGARVGPFARLRGGTVLEAGAEVGNFVEVKKSTLGPGAKAKHLTY